MTGTDPYSCSRPQNRQVQTAAILLLFLLIVLLTGTNAPGQFTGLIETHNNITDLEHTSSIDTIWPIVGRVTTLTGEPIFGAKVKVDIGMAEGKPQIIETNAKGEFKTEYTLNASRFDKVHVKLVASKDGYYVARESADFLAKEKATREITIVLQEESENSELLPLPALVSSLEGRFRSPTALGSVPESARKDFNRGAGELFEQRDSARAVASLAKAVNREPGCTNCRLLLCLAQLSAGSISSAHQQFAEIDKLTGPGKAAGERATVLYIAGVFETWRQENKNAVGFFLKALEIQPSDPLVLLELGRTLVLQQNWEAADMYLEKAIQAGAPTESHLLRARALLEEGDVDGANAEMKMYLGKRPLHSLSLAARMIYLDLQQRLGLKSFTKVKSVVTQPFAELAKAMPELRGMEPASNQDELPSILQKVGENVGAFFRDFPNTISQEEIQVESLRSNGKVQDSLNEKSNYLLLAKAEKWGLGLTEYRASPAGKSAQPTELPRGFMRTKGFASASAVFHPNCQNGATFRYLGRQKVGGRETYVLAFAQQPDKAKMIGMFIANGISEPELTQGVAWTDAQNYQIIRLRTDLLKPLQKVRLIRQTTEIQYAEVHFKDNPAGLWLPQVVTVTVQWKGRTFRNSHHYSDFKLFDVATKEKRKQASLSPETGASVN